MEWLNYHHLLYFWTVAREGSVARASAHLNLAQPTISAQVKQLERALGQPLFERAGRGLVLTDTGRLVLTYADQIFRLGRELLDVLRAPEDGRPITLMVGIAETVPKLIAYRLLQPATKIAPQVRLVCREDHPDRLIAELAIHGLDVVISDAPLPPGVKVRAFSHLLGECGVSFFAAPRLARTYRRGFPRTLEGAPLLLPRDTSALRIPLERWLSDIGVRPRIVGEFDDSALLKVFGESGAGVFPAPAVIEAEVCRHYGVRVIGRAGEVRERFYAIALDRKLSHPAVAAMREAARGGLFPAGGGRSRTRAGR